MGAPFSTEVVTVGAGGKGFCHLKQLTTGVIVLQALRVPICIPNAACLALAGIR